SGAAWVLSKTSTPPIPPAAQRHRAPPSRASADDVGVAGREVNVWHGNRSMKLILLAALAASFVSPVQAQERNDVIVTQLLSATTTSSGQPIRLPREDVQIVVSIYDIMPGATRERHP